MKQTNDTYVRMTNEPPVSMNDVLTVTPDGMAKQDPYVKFHGYVIFLKKVPEHCRSTAIKVRVTAVKEKYAFAEYLGLNED